MKLANPLAGGGALQAKSPTSMTQKRTAPPILAAPSPALDRRNGARDTPFARRPPRELDRPSLEAPKDAAPGIQF
jgi:hypothetical protein